jgi:hypothetical protein
MKFKLILTLFLLLSLGQAMAKVEPDQKQFKFISDNTICRKQGNIWQCRAKEKLFVHSQFGDLPVNITMIKILNGKDNPISMLVTLDESHQQYWVTDCLFQTNLNKQPIGLKTKLVEGINAGQSNFRSTKMPIFDYSDLKMIVDSKELFVVLHVKDLNSSSKDTYTQVVERLSVKESTNLQTLVLGMLLIQK